MCQKVTEFHTVGLGTSSDIDGEAVLGKMGKLGNGSNYKECELRIFALESSSVRLGSRCLLIILFLFRVK